MCVRVAPELLKYMPTCTKCHIYFPNCLTIEGKKRNLSKRKFCILCSPFGKHNTKDLNKYALDTLPDIKECKRCNTQKPKEEFYVRRDRKGLSTYCIECTKAQTLDRQREFKRQCVEYKGNKCEKCGYCKSLSALQFHHIDPTKKDFTIANKNKTKFSDLIKQELDKCLLVCANCHAEIHGTL